MNDHQGDRSTMKKLRHPVRMAREPFGTAGLVVAVIALIAALGGTAFAAATLNSTQKKEVKKIAQTEAKKFAVAGPTGATGPTGPAGAAGKDGANGTNGTPGAAGAAGKNGTNGTNGTNGLTGFTKTLPSGETETGTWTMNQTFVTPFRNAFEAISFPIPLEEGGAAYFFDLAATEGEKFGKDGEEKSCKVEAGKPECVDTGCRGTVAEPTAPAGTLCVYTSFVGEEKEKMEGVAKMRDSEGTLNVFGTAGAQIANLNSGAGATPEEPAFIEAFGSWAVKAK